MYIAQLSLQEAPYPLMLMIISWSICIFCLTVAGVLAKSPTKYLLEDANTYFEHFITKFNKQYANKHEKATHSAIFKNNLDIINRLNQESTDAIYGINKFMDLTVSEFVDKVKCLIGNVTADNSQCQVVTDKDIVDEDAPECFDWRKKSAVTSVKDQGDCRSCYAFSAIGQIEAQNAIKNQRLVDLSPQQVVDCDTRSYKCKGGYMAAAFRTLIEQGGPMRNEDYPYIQKSKKCHSDYSRAAVKVTSCTTYNLKSQEKLKQLLYMNGPIAVGLIGADGMIFYKKGIIMDNQCKGRDINHAVLLVGYGTENGIPYWICKNSLGSNWGETGYFRMQRGEHAHSCGMLNKYMATAEIE